MPSSPRPRVKEWERSQEQSKVLAKQIPSSNDQEIYILLIAKKYIYIYITWYFGQCQSNKNLVAQKCYIITSYLINNSQIFKL